MLAAAPLLWPFWCGAKSEAQGHPDGWLVPGRRVTMQVWQTTISETDLMRCLVLLCVAVLSLAVSSEAAAPVAIGSRLEPFIDRHLIESLSGNAELVMHRPKAAEVVLVTDKPWEGNTSAYYTVFRDDDRLRMYYRGSHADSNMKGTHREVTCYAESRDGIHWTKPELGLFEFEGSRKNNIVWDGIGTHCFSVFKDRNPKCRPEARYKAISRGRPRGKRGLYIFESPDAIHWKLMADVPVITAGAFDSQNLAFFDPHVGLYRAYHRSFVDGVRAIMTETSSDYRTWTKPVLLQYSKGTRNEHLYTNTVGNYPGADHILLGFPTRYLPKESSRVEPVLMTSRDGVHFHRWPDAVVPETAPRDRGGNRSNYMTSGVIHLPSRPDEFSVYATEAYYTGPDSRVRRFVFRKDGIVSVRARRGELTTRTLTFTGRQLMLNHRSLPAGGQDRVAGSVQIELLDTAGRPIEGFALEDCIPLSGDQLSARVRWKGQSDLSSLAGKPLKLRFVVRDSDLFSIRFQ